jgi:hypothetical protein
MPRFRPACDFEVVRWTGCRQRRTGNSSEKLYVMGKPGRYSLDTFSSLLNRVTDDLAALYVFSQAMSKGVASAINFYA